MHKRLEINYKYKNALMVFCKIMLVMTNKIIPLYSEQEIL